MPIKFYTKLSRTSANTNVTSFSFSDDVTITPKFEYLVIYYISKKKISTKSKEKDYQ